MTSNRRAVSAILYLLAGLWVVIAAFPFAWTVWGSFKFETDFFGAWTKNISGEDTGREYGTYFTADGYAIAFSWPIETVPTLAEVEPFLARLSTDQLEHPSIAPLFDAISNERRPSNGELRQFSRWLRSEARQGPDRFSKNTMQFVTELEEERAANVSGKDFGRAVINTLVVTLSVVVISLTFGTLGGYALARSTAKYAFWILIIALVFRAMPHITLVSGYMEPLFATQISEIKIFGLTVIEEGTLWGRTFTAVVVLVAINQPFTIWMMRSFFMNIPQELDESALVDGCNRLQGFWHVIMPVMWPGVITTGLFSFLLAYNDFTVTSALLSQENTTMIPRIAGFLGSAQSDGEQMAAVAAVVSATAPLFVLIMVFQRQLVSGLTAGAVKG